ncbi:hypothetical protein ACFL4G_05280 [Thermodesulfobacteriota bacterium]
MRKVLSIGLGLFLVPALMFGGCGDDDKKDEEPVSGPKAIEFKADNAEALAEIGVGTVNLFANLGKGFWKILDAIPLTKESASLSKETVNDLGNIGFCLGGESNLTWTDTDDDGVLSGGDSAELALVDCAWDEEDLTTLSNGSFDLSFSTVDTTSAVVEFAMNFTGVEQVERDVVTREYVGLFTADADWESRSDVLIRFLVNVDDYENPTIGATFIEDGQTQVEFGCFELGYAFDADDDSFTLSQPFGIYRIPRAGFLSIVSSGLPEDDLIFPTGDYPESGKMEFQAEAIVAPCAALGLEEESVEVNDSSLSLTATGGGGVSLSGEDATGDPYEIDTTWDELS